MAKKEEERVLSIIDKIKLGKERERQQIEDEKKAIEEERNKLEADRKELEAERANASVKIPSPPVSSEEDKKSFLAEFEEKNARQTVEQTHIRRTFLIQRELDARLTALANKKGHGFKTFIINRIIEDALKELESNE